MAQSQFRVVSAGDSAVMVIAGQDISDDSLNRVQWAVRTTTEAGEWPIVSWVLAYATAMGRINPRAHSASTVAEQLSAWLNRQWVVTGGTEKSDDTDKKTRIVRIPVCYEEAFAPDILSLADRLHITPQSLIRMHHSVTYRVAMIGFMPGFPYLLGLPKALASPRRNEPRVRVPAGSVGIGGQQTGIYPQDSPGGWHIIGRTPEPLFRLERTPMFLLEPGDQVLFNPISSDEYRHRKTESNPQATDDKNVRIDITAYRGNHHGAESSRAIHVEKGGLFTTVQDLGRRGYEHQGVTRAGAMDWFASAAANILVGNRPDAAVIECTLVGPSIRFEGDAWVAITGADLEARLDGRTIPLWHSLRVQEGSVLSFAGYRSGCRAYIAVDGGYRVPLVMGSAATDVAQSMGGYYGRALRTGDKLPLGPADGAPHTLRGRLLPKEIRPRYDDPVVGFLTTNTPSGLPKAVVEGFAGSSLTVHPQSDRMGIRLTGWQLSDRNGLLPLSRTTISEPVQPGTIQCPSDGCPLVLMADAQTVGGYPTLGVVAAADLPTLAQVRPGMTLQFEPIPEAEARRRFRTQADSLRWMSLHNH